MTMMIFNIFAVCLCLRSQRNRTSLMISLHFFSSFIFCLLLLLTTFVLNSLLESFVIYSFLINSVFFPRINESFRWIFSRILASHLHRQNRKIRNHLWKKPWNSKTHQQASVPVLGIWKFISWDAAEDIKTQYINGWHGNVTDLCVESQSGPEFLICRFDF